MYPLSPVPGVYYRGSLLWRFTAALTAGATIVRREVEQAVGSAPVCPAFVEKI